jgi:hypothetical protein
MDQVRELFERDLFRCVGGYPGLVLVEILGDETLVPDSFHWMRLSVQLKRRPEHGERIRRRLDSSLRVQHSGRQSLRTHSKPIKSHSREMVALKNHGSPGLISAISEGLQAGSSVPRDSIFESA